ncbi:hypothetical protein ACOSQ3_022600 [Xanthoceras sorbifolium]
MLLNCGYCSPHRAWFEKFRLVVAQQGFTSSPHNTALFLLRSSIGITLILLYVDDMLGICFLQRFLSQYFEMKDLGTLSYFFRLEVTSSSNGYYISQVKYAYDLFTKASITDNKTISIPLE